MMKILYLFGFVLATIFALGLNEEDDKKNIQLLYSTSISRASYELNETNSNDLDPNKKTVFLVHGWIEDGTTNYYAAIFEEYMKKGGYNVIRVNWEKYAKVGYITAKILIERVGNFIGNYINYLHKNNSIPLKKVHIVGHSLGAHVAGIAGYKVQSLNSGQTKTSIRRITGLDPAGPSFNYLTPDMRRLNSKDAEMVDCLYTNRGVFGTISELGSINFYANDAVNQPGCPFDSDNKTNVLFCSHQRSTSLYSESINSHNFIATKFEKMVLNIPIGFNESVKVIFGEDTNAAPGNYHFKTNGRPPYALG